MKVNARIIIMTSPIKFNEVIKDFLKGGQKLSRPNEKHHATCRSLQAMLNDRQLLVCVVVKKWPPSVFFYVESWCHEIQMRKDALGIIIHSLALCCESKPKELLNSQQLNDPML